VFFVNSVESNHKLKFSPTLKQKLAKTSKLKTEFFKTAKTTNNVTNGSNTPFEKVEKGYSSTLGNNEVPFPNGFWTPSNNNYFIFNNIVQIQQ